MTGYPQDVVVQKGDVAEFICETDEDEFINWNYVTIANLTIVRISTGGVVIKGLESKYVSTRYKASNVLTLQNVSMLDAGTYKCIDYAGMGQAASAELIVLGM